MLILSLDLSLNSTGFAVLNYEEGLLEVVEKGVINNHKVPSPLIGKKLFNIEDQLNQLFDRYQEFQAIVKEASFCTQRIKSTQKTFMVLGVVTEACFKNGYSDIKEYSATTVKKIVGGSGKCDKKEVKDNLKYFVGDLKYTTNDESDAVAVAITHLIQQGYKIKLREFEV